VIAVALSAARCCTEFVSYGVSCELPAVKAVSESTVSIIDSGECGAELRLWFDSDGILTISGNDKMTSSPWMWHYSSQIRKVIIDKDVMSICSFAFSGAEALESVESNGASVKSIDAGAFKDCTSLKDIRLPDSVTDIGSEAFSGCTSLKDIYIYGDDTTLPEDSSSIHRLREP
jgi:hypothetical protein